MLALAAGLVAGCGGDDEQNGAPIPQQAAVDLESRLAEVERRMEAGGGACADIENDTLPAVSSIIDSLPQNVDADVRDSLEQSFQRLFQLTQEQCDEQKGQETDTTPAEPLPPPETDTETTETLPPTEEEDQGDGEEAPPTDEVPPEEVPPEEVPPGQGGDGGAGQGGGGGAIVPGEGG